MRCMSEIFCLWQNVKVEIRLGEFQIIVLVLLINCKMWDYLLTKNKIFGIIIKIKAHIGVFLLTASEN